MINTVDLLAYSFLVVAVAVSVFTRLQGELDAVSFIVGRGIVYARGGTANNSESLAAARRSLVLLNQISNPNFIFDINKLDIDNDKGATYLSIRLYNFNQSSVAEKKDVLVWYHGGGWVQGSVEGDDAMCLKFASVTNFVVVSVNYRLAPEYPYPVPLQDSLHALHWVASNIHQYGGDSDRMFVGGESAGANLAAAIAASRISTRQESGEAPLGTLAGLVLVYPPLDNQVRFDSQERYKTTNGLLTLEKMNWLWRLYSGNNQARLDSTEDFLFAPIYAPKTVLSAFPPTFIVLAKHDVLLDEGLEFGRLLTAAGAVVDVDVYDRTIHGFFGRRVFPSGFAALETVAEKLKVVKNL